MADTIVRSQTLVTTVCPVCGVLYAIPDALNEQARRDRGPAGRQIYCPNGHTWHYLGKTDAEKERERRERAEARAQSIQDQLDSEKRSHSATKGTLTKTRKRIGNGTCPHCNRHFINVERHMASKHPEQ